MCLISSTRSLHIRIGSTNFLNREIDSLKTCVELPRAKSAHPNIKPNGNTTVQYMLKLAIETIAATDMTIATKTRQAHAISGTTMIPHSIRRTLRNRLILSDLLFFNIDGLIVVVIFSFPFTHFCCQKVYRTHFVYCIFYICFS